MAHENLKKARNDLGYFVDIVYVSTFFEVFLVDYDRVTSLSVNLGHPNALPTIPQLPTYLKIYGAITLRSRILRGVNLFPSIASSHRQSE